MVPPPRRGPDEQMMEAAMRAPSPWPQAFIVTAAKDRSREGRREAQVGGW